MTTFKITRQVGNPDFASVVRTELATMCFVSYNVVKMVAIVPNAPSVKQFLPHICQHASFHEINCSAGFSLGVDAGNDGRCNRSFTRPHIGESTGDRDGH
ncbi:hypothetical protein TNCV_4386011 [Trichonephila clavipes]|nr:hypothetical protein TNCV_4386011 [Trichonephila clavipes]